MNRRKFLSAAVLSLTVPLSQRFELPVSSAAVEKPYNDDDTVAYARKGIVYRRWSIQHMKPCCGVGGLIALDYAYRDNDDAGRVRKLGSSHHSYGEHTTDCMYHCFNQAPENPSRSMVDTVKGLKRVIDYTEDVRGGCDNPRTHFPCIGGAKSAQFSVFNPDWDGWEAQLEPASIAFYSQRTIAHAFMPTVIPRGLSAFRLTTAIKQV